MVLDHLGDDEVEEFLGEFRVEIGALRQVFEPRDLFGFSVRIGRRKVILGLQLAHSLGVFEPLAQGVDEDRIEAIDAITVVFEDLPGAGDNVVSQERSLSV